MRDVLPDVKAWLQDREAIALATVVSTWGSAPRPAGSRMAVSRSGRLAGSVSGGCLEAEVFEHAQAVIKGGPAQLYHYGVSDDLAWTVGLSCGGEVDILVEPLSDVHRSLIDALDAERPVVLASALTDAVGARRLLEATEPEAPPLLDRATPERREAWFFEPFPRPAELLILGGAHVAIPLSRFAHDLGFRVTVVDARSTFADPGRFPAADRVVHGWPDEVLARTTIDQSSYVVVLTHDPKFDDPTIRAALKGNARYIGAIGSRKTHRARVERLLALGVSQSELDRVHAPIGLDLGGQTAEETALAILAEIVAVRHQRAGRALSGAAPIA
ncbi:MAG: XdhC family protein [Candidatus Dormibacteraeota bacterium]|nr:XdhC family protein [Candidatus Dormibacteraeota bacterium]